MIPVTAVGVWSYMLGSILWWQGTVYESPSNGARGKIGERVPNGEASEHSLPGGDVRKLDLIKHRTDDHCKGILFN
jgi:hypothetical protein